MQQSASSMQHVDERILEYLSETIWSSPDLLAVHVEAPPPRIAERLQVMARLGYVVPTIDGDKPEEATMWELGTWGERHMTREGDAELVWPAPVPWPPEAVRPGWWAEFG